MEKTGIKRLLGGNNIREKLLLAALSGKAILMREIRADDINPGLRSHEISLLHLLEKISDGCVIEINETGTKFKYKPGILIGGTLQDHYCGDTRAIGYFLEPLIILGLFSRKSLTVRLKGITNDLVDPSVDTFRSTVFPMLVRFGVPEEGLKLKIENRGVPPEGGGSVLLSVPSIQNLSAVTWIDEGLIKRIRGVSFSAMVSSQFENAVIYAARGIFNNLLPDVHIFTDHRVGAEAGKSPGYGISLTSESTSGCFISVDTAVSYPHKDKMGEAHFDNKDLAPPGVIGERIASSLLEEIEKGGVVDSTSQGILFLLCALCPKDVCKVRVGKLSPHGIETLRLIKEFLNVIFSIKADPSTGTVILKCLGSGITNFSRRRS